MSRVVIIGNCHCLPIAKTVALGLTSHSCEFIDVNFLGHEPHISRVAALTSNPADYVFSFVLSDQWPTICASTLRPLYKDRLVTFTNVHFEGLHPDITYMGSMGARVRGALGDYHSKLILYSYVTGRSTEDCVRLFSTTDFEAIGFYSAFERSSAILLQRDEACDVKFAQTFVEMAKTRLTMYTVNHPTDSVFLELSRLLCAHVGLEYTVYPIEYLTNSLSDNIVWPIYERIAAHHNLSFRTPQTFLGPNTFNGRTIPLADLVTRYYATYSSIPSDEFSTAIKQMPFFAEFVRVLA
jgi:hypothetical protein